MATGGPIKEIDIGGRTFKGTGDNAPNIKLGGVENEHQSNGDKTARTIKTPTCWKIGGLAIVIDNTNGDLEYLRDIQNGDDVDIVLTYRNNVVRHGVGNIEGELNEEPASASTSIDLGGGGELKII